MADMLLLFPRLFFPQHAPPARVSGNSPLLAPSSAQNQEVQEEPSDCKLQSDWDGCAPSLLACYLPLTAPHDSCQRSSGVSSQCSGMLTAGERCPIAVCITSLELLLPSSIFLQIKYLCPQLRKSLEPFPQRIQETKYEEVEQEMKDDTRMVSCVSHQCSLRFNKTVECRFK